MVMSPRVVSMAAISLQPAGLGLSSPAAQDRTRSVMTGRAEWVSRDARSRPEPRAAPWREHGEDGEDIA